MDFVDTHLHAISDDPVRYPIAPIGGKRSDWSSERPITVDTVIQHMDHAGVRQAVLVHSSTTYGHDASYAADSVARFSDRLVGVCSIDGVAPDAAERLRYWIEERGMSGVRCFTQGSTMAEPQLWLDKPEAVPFWEEVKRLHIPVAVSTRPVGLPMVQAVVSRYPEIVILLDHMNQPVVEDGPPFERARPLLDLSRYPNVYLKITPASLRHISVGKSTPEAFLPVVADKFGVRRMMYGSNFPSSFAKDAEDPYVGNLDQMRKAVSFMSEDEQRWFFSESARSVYPGLRAEARSV